MDSNNKQLALQIKNHKKLVSDGNNDISLTKILNSDHCQRILSECRDFRDRIYTPLKKTVVQSRRVLRLKQHDVAVTYLPKRLRC